MSEAAAADQAVRLIPVRRTSDHAETFAVIADRIAEAAPRFTPDQVARIGALLDASAPGEAAPVDDGSSTKRLRRNTS